MTAKEKQSGLPMPIKGMLLVGILGALVSAACFFVIVRWPLPISVAPYFGWKGGLVWGAVVGALAGLVIGYLTDDKHFSDTAKY